jgi:predicted TIM-barrel fold metal-dependent hydrolase
VASVSQSEGRTVANSLIIDADSHVTEPADLWTSRVPKKYVDQVPHVERNADGKDVWVFIDTVLDTVGLTAIAGWKTFPMDYPSVYEDLHPACGHAADRLKYLDEAGIWAQVLYPNVAGFGSRRFLALPDEELKLTCVRAYNDFLVEEWMSVDSKRLIPIATLPFWDVEASVAEIQRVAALGFRGILFTGEPQRFGLPVLGDHHWDPLYAAAEEAGTPIHFHIGFSEDLPASSIVAPRITEAGSAGAETFFAVNLFMKNGVQAMDITTSGVLERYPTLNFVTVESGVGWAPFVLEAADHVFLNSTKTGFSHTGEMLPSELFRRQVYCTYWFEKLANMRIEDLPLDNILFETDFPHPACLYGNIDETIEAGLAGMSQEIRDKVLFQNSTRLYKIELPTSI